MKGRLLIVLLLAGAAQAAERPARARLCPENLPEGVRLPAQPGCEAAAGAARPRDPGFRDLGDGTSVRIGGRVGAAFGVGR